MPIPIMQQTSNADKIYIQYKAKFTISALFLQINIFKLFNEFYMLWIILKNRKPVFGMKDKKSCAEMSESFSWTARPNKSMNLPNSSALTMKSIHNIWQ